jgi:DNA helicase HerA-like ATPase
MAAHMLNLGAWCPISGDEGGPKLLLPAKHLVTHAAVLGMTGSGKTGLVTVLVEEALRAEIPTLVIDIKGDLPNLLLTFPSNHPEEFRPWLERDGVRLPDEQLEAELTRRREALERASLGDADLEGFSERTHVRVITPGSSAGEPLHVLSPLERRSSRWDTDPESAQSALSAAVSLVLRLLGRDPDPAKSKDHVLLSVLAERRLRLGEQADISALMTDLQNPPIATVGALPINSFMKKTERQDLVGALNSLLASPTFASWREGASLDVGEWLTPKNGRTPGVILSVAHLDDEERALVLGVVFEEVLSWVRSLRGSSELKALVVFDEVYGFLPPHPANPPTKRPIVALMKQARAFGVGVVVATQNPMDLDYRALSNAGLWCIGRLQTDADRARVTEGLASSVGAGTDVKELNRCLSKLAPRWFVMRNAHVPEAGSVLLNPRHTMSLMRGPLTRAELRMAREKRAGEEAPCTTEA